MHRMLWLDAPHSTLDAAAHPRAHLWNQFARDLSGLHPIHKTFGIAMQDSEHLHFVPPPFVSRSSASRTAAAKASRRFRRRIRAREGVRAMLQRHFSEPPLRRSRGRSRPGMSRVATISEWHLCRSRLEVGPSSVADVAALSTAEKEHF